METKTLKLTSNLVAATVEVMQAEVEELYELNLSEVILDMQMVSLIDSTGIGFLIRMQNTLEKKSGKLVLVNVHEDIKKMLQIMRLDKHITIK